MTTGSCEIFQWHVMKNFIWRIPSITVTTGNFEENFFSINDIYKTENEMV